MGSATEFWTLNSVEWHSAGVVSSLSATLEIGDLPPQYYLSALACAGILRRAETRGKELPPLLKKALIATVYKQQSEPFAPIPTPDLIAGKTLTQED
jgi:hypothetical protein